MTNEQRPAAVFLVGVLVGAIAALLYTAAALGWLPTGNAADSAAAPGDTHR